METLVALLSYYKGEVVVIGSDASGEELARLEAVGESGLEVVRGVGRLRVPWASVIGVEEFVGRQFLEAPGSISESFDVAIRIWLVGLPPRTLPAQDGLQPGTTTREQ